MALARKQIRITAFVAEGMGSLLRSFRLCLSIIIAVTRGLRMYVRSKSFVVP